MRSPPKRRFYPLEKLLKFIEDLRNVGQYPNWAELDPSIDRLLAEGWNIEEIAKDIGVRATTIRKHLGKREAIGTPIGHYGTPEHYGIPQEHPDHFELEHQSTPESTEISLDEQYT
jgi:hypothetical protein